ncbi:MAG: biotin--[acetyl-CoA-carboxylase] ligase [Cyclobacteriaceae bacterium]|nr:biotin--[acetyl-CoA-carboxylase] ligase [Cyclobacteriaceae bacterium]
MFKAPESTLFMGKRIVSVASCDSTNLLAADLLNSGAVADGMLVITDEQRAGRGQRGNTWQAQPGMNLTFTLVLHPLHLKVVDQFYLSMAVALGVRDYLAGRLTGSFVKWPNDLMVNDRKIGGLLIENQIAGQLIKSSLVGIGLNINQRDLEGLAATSLAKVNNRNYDLQAELGDLLQSLEARWQQLQSKEYQTLADHYTRLLYGHGAIHTFRAADKLFRGTICGVDRAGRLLIDDGEEILCFQTKEVRFASEGY